MRWRVQFIYPRGAGLGVYNHPSQASALRHALSVQGLYTRQSPRARIWKAAA